MFRNRLRKNLKRLKKHFAKRDIECYRVYDRDIPEFRCAVDWYAGDVIFHEYAASGNIDNLVASKRVTDAIEVIKEVFSIGDDQIKRRTRAKQDGQTQYRKKEDHEKEYTVINEGPCRYWVDLDTYLDSGIFLDMRAIRERLYVNPPKRLLNLFAYTCTASVAAAAAGSNTTNVDLSGPYLKWGRRNYSLNDIDADKHAFIRGDVGEYLRRQAGKETFDHVLIAPPSFSRSKAMRGVFDIKRDHVALIDGSARLLSAGGQMMFLTHARDFRLKRELEERYQIRETSDRTVPIDHRGAHRSWLLSPK